MARHTGGMLATAAALGSRQADAQGTAPQGRVRGTEPLS
jgi:hypothetical protein